MSSIRLSVLELKLNFIEAKLTTYFLTHIISLVIVRLIKYLRKLAPVSPS